MRGTLPEQAANGARAQHRRRRSLTQCAVYGMRLEVDIVDAHHLAPVDVNNLLIQQIAFQQQQPSALLANKGTQ